MGFYFFHFVDTRMAHWGWGMCANTTFSHGLGIDPMGLDISNTTHHIEWMDLQA
jgi:hypothetical protein